MTHALLNSMRPIVMVLLGQQQMAGRSFWIVAAIVILFVLVFFSYMLLMMRQFKRCPSNRVLVVTGRTGHELDKTKCIHGGMTFIMPLFQDYAWLSLEPIRFELALSGVSKGSDERITAAGTFSIAIGTTPELMQAAADRLVGLPSQEIQNHAEVIIHEVVKRCFAETTCKEIQDDRENIMQTIRDSVEPELHKLGLVLISFYADFESERNFR